MRQVGEPCFPAASGTTVYLPLRSGDLLALNPADGSQRWKTAVGAKELGWLTAAPDGVLAGGVVPRGSGSDTGLLVAVSSAGAKRWSLATQGWPWRCTLGPDGTIYVATSTGWLYALDPADGRIRRAAQVTSQANEAVADDARLYVATYRDGVLALSRTGGGRVWQVPSASTGVVAGLAIDADHVYYTEGTGTSRADYGGTLRSVDARTGRVGWEFSFDGLIQAGPVLADGRLFVPDNRGVLWAVDAATGAAVWRASVAANVWSRVSVAGDTVYAGTGTGAVALAAASGRYQWRTDVVDEPPRNAEASTPALGDGVLYIGYGDLSIDSNTCDLYCLTR
jgi:outer membrane protein assembly factor BamB